MKNSTRKLFFFLSLIIVLTTVYGQERERIAVISIDSRNLDWDNITMANIVRFELEKIDGFEVLDKYDVTHALESNKISPDDCFGKNKLIEVGNLLGAEKMLTGSAELFGDKIIMIMRMIDVKTKQVNKTSVMEYLNAQDQLQTMCMISLNELLDIENDPHLVDLLINYNLPITTMATTASLSGPRMGAMFTTGNNGRRLQDPKSTGGYNMFPVSTMFGYQFEKQYMSSGDFQALVEVIPAITGLESGSIIPSITVLNGFRFNQGGYEFALGPILRLVKTEEGAYSDGRWVRSSEMDSSIVGSVKTKNLVDSRGTLRPSLRILVAVGKTFKSGYLNIPVNLYYSPVKDGSTIGISIGFNTSKKPSFK